jgi:ribonuclease HI
MLLYTDGSCNLVKGVGGWAVVDGNEMIVLKSGSAIGTTVTNNRMELQAIIEAVKLVNEPSNIIYTDSQYACNGITKWFAKWVKNNFKTASGSPVKNQDLWIELKTALVSKTQEGIHIDFEWVRAHNGDLANSIADTACYNQMLAAAELIKSR